MKERQRENIKNIFRNIYVYSFIYTRRVEARIGTAKHHLSLFQVCIC